MLKISLTESAKKDLLIAKTRSDIPSDRITTILLVGDGLSASRVAAILGYHTNTVREYIKAYLNSSIEGLSRNYSTGRPSDKKEPLKAFLKLCLEKPATDYGYDRETWDSTNIIAAFEKESGLVVSHDTVSRAMKELGYSYKKPQKSPSINAPCKEEKIRQISEIISLIKKDLDKKDAEIYCSDESHFTNEPYLPKGYFKKGTENIDSRPEKARNKKPDWFIKLKDWEVFLEKR